MGEATELEPSANGKELERLNNGHVIPLHPLTLVIVTVAASLLVAWLTLGRGMVTRGEVELMISNALTSRAVVTTSELKEQTDKVDKLTERVDKHRDQIYDLGVNVARVETAFHVSHPNVPLRP